MQGIGWEKNGMIKRTTTGWTRAFGVSCGLGVALSLIFIALGGAGLAARESRRQGEVTVGLRPGVDINRVISRHGAYVKDRIPNSANYLLGLPPRADLDRYLRQLRADADLLFAEPNYNFRPPELRQVSQAFIDQVSQAFIDGQSPASFYGQTQVLNLHLTEAHSYSQGRGVKVAVIDTGLDFSHPLFAGRTAVPVFDFVDNDSQPNDELRGAGSGHGTFVAGLIALAAPEAKLMPLRVFDRDGIGSSFNVARAIRFATDNGAKVINMSFGLLEQDQLIRESLNYAYGRAYLIASAGNDNQNSIQFPADIISRVLSVTSTTAFDIKASFANYHTQMYASSPGVLLYSAYPGRRWAWWSGTSFSTALVTGEAALLLALAPGIYPADLDRLIVRSGRNIDAFNPAYAGDLGRRIDFRDAVLMLLSGR
jgi:subtilisin family serine protease